MFSFLKCFRKYFYRRALFHCNYKEHEKENPNASKHWRLQENGMQIPKTSFCSTEVEADGKLDPVVVAYMQ